MVDDDAYLFAYANCIWHCTSVLVLTLSSAVQDFVVSGDARRIVQVALDESHHALQGESHPWAPLTCAKVLIVRDWSRIPSMSVYLPSYGLILAWSVVPAAFGSLLSDGQVLLDGRSAT